MKLSDLDPKDVQSVQKSSGLKLSQLKPEEVQKVELKKSQVPDPADQGVASSLGSVLGGAVDRVKALPGALLGMANDAGGYIKDSVTGKIDPSEQFARAGVAVRNAADVALAPGAFVAKNLGLTPAGADVSQLASKSAAAGADLLGGDYNDTNKALMREDAKYPGAKLAGQIGVTLPLGQSLPAIAGASAAMQQANTGNVNFKDVAADTLAAGAIPATGAVLGGAARGVKALAPLIPGATEVGSRGTLAQKIQGGVNDFTAGLASMSPLNKASNEDVSFALNNPSLRKVARSPEGIEELSDARKISSAEVSSFKSTVDDAVKEAKNLLKGVAPSENEANSQTVNSLSDRIFKAGAAIKQGQKTAQETLDSILQKQTQPGNGLLNTAMQDFQSTMGGLAEQNVIPKSYAADLNNIMRDTVPGDIQVGRTSDLAGAPIAAPTAGQEAIALRKMRMFLDDQIPNTRMKDIPVAERPAVQALTSLRERVNQMLKENPNPEISSAFKEFDNQYSRFKTMDETFDKFARVKMPGITNSKPVYVDDPAKLGRAIQNPLVNSRLAGTLDRADGLAGSSTNIGNGVRDVLPQMENSRLKAAEIDDFLKSPGAHDPTELNSYLQNTLGTTPPQSAELSRVSGLSAKIADPTLDALEKNALLKEAQGAPDAAKYKQLLEQAKMQRVMNTHENPQTGQLGSQLAAQGMLAKFTGGVSLAATPALQPFVWMRVIDNAAKNAHKLGNSGVALKLKTFSAWLKNNTGATPSDAYRMAARVGIPSEVLADIGSAQGSNP